MNCIRCGRETEDNQVFCTECLQDMEKHPVKPGTPIQLPVREPRTVTKRSSFRVAASKWEDQIFRLKYTIVWLVIIIILLAAALALCVCLMLQIGPGWLDDLVRSTPLQAVIERSVT